MQVGLDICVSPAHSFGTDAFILSDFASPKKHEIACDLGTGCGIIPVLWFKTGRVSPKKVFAVDIQPQAIEQLFITVEHNRLDGRILPLCADLREIKSAQIGESLDLITCNPPYKAAGAGIQSELDCEKIARHEVTCGIDDVAAAAERLLKFGGRLCICQRPERLCDVISAMKSHKIEPKRLRFVHKDESSAPWLFVIEGKKGAKPFLTVEKPFLMRCGGVPTFEAQNLYRSEE